MKKYFTKEVQIALSVIISGLILFFGINYLKGINILKASNYYFARYQNVQGISISTPVTIDGFQVGLVRNMQYDYANGGGVIVEIGLNDALKVPEGTTLQLNTDLLGSAHLNLIKPDVPSGSFCHPGDTILGENAPDMMGALQNELLPKINEILPKVDSIVSGIQTLIQHPALTQSISHLEGMTANLEASSVKINRLLTNDLPPVLSNIHSLTGNLNTFTQDLNRLNLPQTVTYVDSTLLQLQALTHRLSTPTNTLGLLLSDPALYNRLVQTAGSADSLLLDLRKNPKRYVRFSLF